MAFHSNSPTLLSYLQNTITSLIEPIEKVALDLWDGENDIPNCYNIIHYDLSHYGRMLAILDGDLSDNEAALLTDIDIFFGEENCYNTIRELRDNLRKSINKYKKSFTTFNIPQTILYLQIFDSDFGTDYANEARELFIRFANTILRSDGKLSKENFILFLLFKSYLYRPDSFPETLAKIQSEVLKIKMKNAVSNEK